MSKCLKLVLMGKALIPPEQNCRLCPAPTESSCGSRRTILLVQVLLPASYRVNLLVPALRQASRQMNLLVQAPHPANRRVELLLQALEVTLLPVFSERTCEFV